MHPGDAAELLTLAAAFDNRTPTESAAMAWAVAIDDHVNLADAKVILAQHYASTRDWIMPADINLRSREMRAARLRDMQTPEPPEALDGNPAREIGWQRTYRRLVGDGMTEAEADARACEEHGVTRVQIEAAPRPVQAAIEGHRASCRCGCLTRPVRAEEGRP